MVFNERYSKEEREKENVHFDVSLFIPEKSNI
jgi:hypothetical protein